MDSQPKKKKPRTFEPMTSGSWGAWSTTELRSTEHIKLNIQHFRRRTFFWSFFSPSSKIFLECNFLSDNEIFLLQNFLPFPFATKSRDYEKRTLSFLLLTQLLFCAINVFLDENWAFGQLTSVRHKKNYMTANFAFLQHSKKILVGSVQFIFRLHNFHFLKIGEKLHGRIIYSDFYKKMFIKISLKLTCKESS